MLRTDYSQDFFDLPPETLSLFTVAAFWASIGQQGVLE
jgi:hypothetical protein